MNKILSATLALLLATGVAARAAVVLTLDAPVASFDGYEYGGSIFNNSADPVTLDGTSFTLPVGITVDDVFSDLTFGDLPLTLTGFGSYSTNDFFTLTVPGGFGPLSGTYALDGDGVALASVDFAIPAPEPASMLMFGAGLLGLAAMRRLRGGV